jgi:hypothetical protein
MKMTTPIARMIMLLYLQECAKHDDDDGDDDDDDGGGDDGERLTPTSEGVLYHRTQWTTPSAQDCREITC